MIDKWTKSADTGLQKIPFICQVANQWILNSYISIVVHNTVNQLLFTCQKFLFLAKFSPWTSPLMFLIFTYLGHENLSPQTTFLLVNREIKSLWIKDGVQSTVKAPDTCRTKLTQSFTEWITISYQMTSRCSSACWYYREALTCHKVHSSWRNSVPVF